MSKIFGLSQKTLRFKLIAWYSFISILILLLFTGYLYLQLEKNLIAQLDTNLQIAASQNFSNIIRENDHLRLRKFVDSPLSPKQLNHFAVRLLSGDGELMDGIGNYQAFPLYLPTQNGYVDLKGSNYIWRIYSEYRDSSSAWLQVAEPLNPIYNASRSLLKVILLGVPLVFLMICFGGTFLTNRTLQPIQRIITTAESISAKDITKRINYHGPSDELGRLARTIDRMLNRLQISFENERRFSANAAHELRTPLTVIKGRIGVTLSRERTLVEYENTLRDLDREADRLIRLSNGLLFLARLEQAEINSSLFQVVDLSNLLIALVEQIQPLAEAKKIYLQDNILPDLFIQGNPDYLTNLFLNLLDNALKYTPNGGLVEVIAKQEDTDICIKFKDTGMGIDTKDLPYLFNRFYRVEKSLNYNGGGTGLGLAIAKEIARLHGGSLDVKSQLNQGTTFTLKLPLYINKEINAPIANTYKQNKQESPPL